ncbi:MAG: carboxylating nicotinate-nucleotide diphosphorylase [Geitlerinemataceae cyanobacterium]
MITLLPPPIVLDPLLHQWLLEDIGRGDRTTQGLFGQNVGWGNAEWIAKEAGTIAGLPIAARVFHLLNEKVSFVPLVEEGKTAEKGQKVARLQGAVDALLMGERVALNLAMRLSGIATLTRQYTEKIADLPAQLVDTRKTTPGLRILEKYATQVGGAINHRMGLDDAVMVKDNHIQAAGGIDKAIDRLRRVIPYPLAIEVETNTIDEVQAAIENNADIIMLDNMPIERMIQAVKLIRDRNSSIKIEASGNVTLDTLRSVAETGVDYISSSAPITRSTWLDFSMKLGDLET